MRSKLFFVGVLLTGLFCNASVLLAEKTPLQKLQEYEQKIGPKVLATEKTVLVDRTQKGFVFVGDQDVLDKLKVVANILGDNEIHMIEYRDLKDGGVEVFFSIRPVVKK